MPRDQLLAALWPAAGPESALQTLYTTASRLRSLLREQVLGLDGEIVHIGREGICRLDTTRIASDAQRFATLCRAAAKLKPDKAKAALHAARRLYHGDLLAGQPYVWAEEDYTGYVPRKLYRDMYRQATRRLARLLCEEGQPARAVPLYKGLLKAEPTLEDVVRDLYRCYEQLGDLGALIREDRELRQALRGEDDDSPSSDDCQPEKATVDLFKRIRAELETGGRTERAHASAPLNGRASVGRS